MNYQFDGVMAFIACDVHIVHQVFYQEQAPPARRLQPGQLGLQVGCLRLRYRLAATMIDDAYRDGLTQVSELRVGQSSHLTCAG